MQTTKRPNGITIFAVLAIVVGVVMALGGLAQWAFESVFASDMGVADGEMEAVLRRAVPPVVLGILAIICGIGSLFLQPWAWFLGVAVAILMVLNAIFTAVTSGAIVGALFGQAFTILISAATLFFLFSPGVRSAFRRA